MLLILMLLLYLLLLPIPHHFTCQFSMHDFQAFLNHHSSFSSNHLSFTMFVITGKSSWFFDTACCIHMTFDPTLFTYKVSVSHISDIHATDGSSMSITHVGLLNYLLLTPILFLKFVLTCYQLVNYVTWVLMFTFLLLVVLFKIYKQNKLFGQGVKLDNFLSSFLFKLILY